MVELENRIARLEMQVEQLLIHLKRIDHDASEAAAVRPFLLVMLEKLAELKGERQRRADLIDLPRAA